MTHKLIVTLNRKPKYGIDSMCEVIASETGDPVHVVKGRIRAAGMTGNEAGNRIVMQMLNAHARLVRLGID